VALVPKYVGGGELLLVLLLLRILCTSMRRDGGEIMAVIESPINSIAQYVQPQRASHCHTHIHTRWSLKKVQKEKNEFFEVAELSLADEPLLTEKPSQIRARLFPAAPIAGGQRNC
jgi:hypothetical protein